MPDIRALRALHRPRLAVAAPAAMLLAALVAGLLLPLPSVAQQRFDLASTATLLPKTVLPQHVRLQLALDPDQPTFGGDVAITLRVSAAVPAITLHARQLQASSVTLTRLGGEDAAPASASTTTATPAAATARALQVQPDEATSTWRLADGQAIAPGSYRLDIAYRGQVQASDQGLYAANFRQQGQPARWLATQLEAIDARRLMPSFDEPVFRTVFQVQVTAPAGLQVLSNMPLLQTEPVAGGTLHSFAATPPMPSYLLAVTVGRFDVLDDSVGKLPLRIFTVPGKREQARFAMDSTKQIVPFYAQYFGQPFKLPKLDQVGVPGTRNGAMEDWGLISYSDSLLLFDPQRSNEDSQRRIFAVVAHEIAHQWFGDLVSVASWNEIWLNEAFATWMEQKAAERFHADWQTPLRERVLLEGVMARDATPSTRAIRSGPVVESTVDEVFDGVTYRKGGAVLSMLEQWLGADVFQRGLAAYMAERALKPATAGDLWFHIGRAAGQPVAAVAASWTDQPGLPLLQVTARCDTAGAGPQTVLTLAQSRFSQDTPLPPGLWQLPLRLVRGSGATAQQRVLVFGKAQDSVTLPGCSSQPVLANAGGRGYYVTDYDALTWDALGNTFATLQPAERVALLSDSFALAQSGRRAMAAHFALLRQLPQVHDAGRAALYTHAASEWQTFDTALDDTPAQAALRHAGQALFGPELQRLGWTPVAGEPSETASLRGTLIRRLATLDDPATLAGVQQRFAAALIPSGPGALPRSVRDAVLTSAGRQVDEAGFEQLLAALLAAEDTSERWLLAAAISSGQDPARAERVLALTLTDRLPPDLRVVLPGMVAQVPALAPLVYRFTLAHWAELAATSGEGGFGGRHNLLPRALGPSHDPAQAAQMQRDQQRLDGPAGDTDAAIVLAQVQARARLRAREAPQLAQALQGWSP